MFQPRTPTAAMISSLIRSSPGFALVAAMCELM
jgi:hypothetical protein